MLATAAFGSAFAGCSGSQSDTTVITVMNTGGGVGRLWLDNAIERFTASKEGYSYEDGKTGVSFEVEHTLDTGVETMSTSGYNIYFDASSPTVLSLQQSGNVICIDDIVKEKSDTRNGTSISIEDRSKKNRDRLSKAQTENITRFRSCIRYLQRCNPQQYSS